MRVSTTAVLSLAGLSALSFAAAGCSSDSKGGGRTYLSTGVAPVTSAAVIAAAASGQLPGVPGLQGYANMFAEGPGIEITSPARAAFLPSGNVSLQAKVTDKGHGVTQVHVNGMSVALAANGTVTTNVALTPGVNTIVVEAWDTTQRKTERHVSVLAGDVESETTALPRSSAIRLTDDALDAMEPGITQAIDAQRQALIQQVMSSNLGKDTRARGFTFGAVQAQVDAVPGGLAFQIDVSDIALDFEVKVKILFFFSKTKRGTIRAQNLRINGVAQIALDANGQLTSQVTGVSAQVTGFSVPSFADKYKGQIQNAFTQGFATQGAQQMSAQLSTVLNAAQTSGTVTQTVLGQSIRSEWKLAELRFDDFGMTSIFGGNVRAVNPVAGATQDKSWVVRTPIADLIGSGPGWNGAVAVHQDAVNQALHAAWRAGAFQFTLDPQTANQLVPGAGATLNSSSLAALSPGLSAFIPPSLPMKIEVLGQLPPTVKVRENAPHQMDLSLASVRVKTSLSDPQTGNTIDLGEAIYSVEAEVSMIEQGGKVRLVPNGQLKVRVDLVGSAMPGTENLLEQVADSIAGPLVRGALANSAGLPLPAINGAGIANVQFMASGQSLIAFGTTVPAPATPGQNP